MKIQPASIFAFTGMALLFLTPVASGGTISWGVASAGADDFDLYSDGQPIFDNGFSYDLGVFMVDGTGTAFEPTINNLAVWGEHWVKVGATSVFNPGSGTYGETVAENLFAGIPEGRRVFIWGYNSRDLVETSEWVLYTGRVGTGATVTDEDWVSPDPAGAEAFAVEWAPRTASEALIGRISSTDREAAGGMISNAPVLGENSIQTGAVPEPSVVGLLAGASVVLLLRRGRS
jgi:hypothetical protein